MEINIERYRKQFYREAREILDNIYDDILKAEADPGNPELLNSIFRGVHTIKGSIGIFELENVARFTHQLESLLKNLRDGRIELNPETVDIILAGVDHISKMIQDHEQGKTPVTDAELLDQFAAFIKTEGVESEIQEPVPEPQITPATLIDINELSLASDLSDRLRKLASRGFNIFRIRVKYSSEHLENGYDPYAYLKKLHQCCCFCHVTGSGSPVPPPDMFDPMTLYLQPVIIAAAEYTYEFMADLAFDPSLAAIEQINACQIEEREYEAPEVVDSESLKEFILGSTEMLESAERAAIAYESGGNPALLNEIFRVVHNIKGDADFVGLKQLNTFAHTLESLLDRIRSGVVIKDSADIILKSLDYLWRCVRKLNQGIEITDFPPVYETLKQYSAPKTASAGQPAPDGTEEVKVVFSEQALQYKSILVPVLQNGTLNQPRKSIVLRAVKGMANAAGSLKMNRLRELAIAAAETVKAGDEQDIIRSVGDILTFLDESEIGPRRIGEILIQEGKVSEEDLNQCLSEQKRIGELLIKAGKVSEEDIEQALKRPELMESARQMKGAQPPDIELRSMRVDESKIEQLTNIAGELLIARNVYDFILNRLNRSGGADREIGKALKDNLHLFTRLTNDIHYGVMSLRMIPIGGIFRKFTRVVRDIGRKQRKFIELIIEGETVEIDKKAADVLADPLVHLIRNACDHGIETGAERIAKGKPEKGVLKLKAFQKGGHLCISVSDDGCGINRKKLFEKGRSMGFDPVSPDDPNILDLIFLPGLSTLSESTEISGRGVGMDVVKTTVQSLCGSVKVTSEENKGAEVVLFIPMTMGIDSVLLVQISGQSYAIPLSNIESTLKLPAKAVRRAVDQKLFCFRGDVIPLQRLDTLLSGKKPASENSGASINRLDDDIPVVILRTGRGRLGVIVDNFVKNTELAIKPLPPQLSGLKIAGGVSIMGDGKIILLINPDNL